jgi:hypothetical protein
MKKSELKQYIKEQIISVLSEAEQGTIFTKDERKAQDLAKKGHNVRIDEEEEEEDTWYKSEEDSFVEKEPSAKDLKKNSSMVKLQSKYTEVTKQMKSLANKYKQADATEKTQIVAQLKDLTRLKKELEAMINPSIEDDED